MTIARATTFGRRGLKPAQQARGPVNSQGDNVASNAPVDEHFTAMAREMLRSSNAGPSPDGQSARRGGNVPWSMRAAVLASIAASAFQAGLYALSATGPLEIIPGLKLSIDRNQAVLIAVTLGLWSGVRIATTAVMATHVVMRFVQASSHVAYAVGGAISGGVYALGLQILTNQHQNVLVTAATALAAGFLYRMFAGRS